ncbi:MAG: iron-containing alcohol dehydrogenase [Planctomycetes bacterium]|nr:iron-containing alcohol dehydrogenase [Planctomycetota bacterium]
MADTQDKYYEFRLRTKIIFQSGGSALVAEEAARLGLRRPFIITDRVVLRLGLLDRLTGLEPCGTFPDVPQDSEVSIVERAAALMKERGADGIVALGGGSVIDTAKAVNIVFSLGGRLADHEGVGTLDVPLAPFVALPTTAGTGSEVSQHAMVKDASARLKIPFTSHTLAADTAVLDPALTVSMPPPVTAATGLDAMTHAIEAVFAANASPLTDALAAGAARDIREWLPRAVKNGQDLDARGRMLLAANAAGVAFSNAGVGVVHALAHGCGALRGVPHGVANALLLPHGVRFNRTAAPEKHALLERIFGEDVAGALAALTRACGLPTRLRDANVRPEDLPALAEYGEHDGALIFNPREASREDLLGILQAAF